MSEHESSSGGSDQSLLSLCRAHGLPLRPDEVGSDPDDLFDRLAAAGVSAAEGRRLQLARALGMASAERHHESDPDVERLESRLDAAIAECERLRTRGAGVLAALETGALLSDAEGRVVGVNHSACALTGLNREALHEVALAPLLERLDQAADVDVRRRPMPDGRSQLVLVTRRAAEAAADTTTAPADVGRSDDAAFERLAVLTHKINNPLTSLLGRTQILQAQHRDDPVLGKALGVIGESAQRIAELVREVAQLARRGKLDGSRLIDPDR